MQKNTFLKISLGVGTGLYFLTPWLMLGLVMITMPFFILAESYYADATILFMFVMFLFGLICLLAGLLHVILMPVYISLLLRNTTGSLLMRTLLGVGLLFIPCIAAPVYYLTFIVPAQPPAWAVDARSGNTAADTSIAPEIPLAAPQAQVEPVPTSEGEA